MHVPMTKAFFFTIFYVSSLKKLKPDCNQTWVKDAIEVNVYINEVKCHVTLILVQVSIIADLKLLKSPFKSKHFFFFFFICKCYV